MLKKSQLSLAVGAALGLTTMTFMPANAQELSANQLEEVIVTGSRIQRANLVSASPVSQVDAEELLFTGNTRVEDLVKNLPQVYSQQNSTQQNGATGTATLNLRNLGDERTLTLINGRRMPAGSPVQGGQGADINQIPGALIKRVEVLTGGASATWVGSSLGSASPEGSSVGLGTGSATVVGTRAGSSEALLSCTTTRPTARTRAAAIIDRASAKGQGARARAEIGAFCLTRARGPCQFGRIRNPFQVHHACARPLRRADRVS